MLKLMVASLDEVEEAFRALYTEREGKFYLTKIEGLKTQGDVDNVLRATRQEREAHAKTKEELKTALEKLNVWGELVPEDVTTKLEKLAHLEAAGNVPELAKNFETVVNQRVETLLGQKLKGETSKLDKRIAELSTQLGTLQTENQGLHTSNTNRTIGDAVRAAAAKAKVMESAIPDAMLHGTGSFKIVEGKVQTEDGVTPDQWIEDRKQTSPHWWPATRGTGAGNNNGGDIGLGGFKNPWTKDSWSVTDQMRMAGSDPKKAEQMAASANSKVGASGPTGFVWNKGLNQWVEPQTNVGIISGGRR